MEEAYLQSKKAGNMQGGIGDRLGGFPAQFRDREIATGLSRAIQREAVLPEYRIMEFCGGHTHAIFRYGLLDLLPDHIRFIHGPGCPVCVLPTERIDYAIRLAITESTILCTYGDLFRVPGTGARSLQKARSGGADVRMIYSPLDALRLAEENPDKRVVFFAIGFETTAPATADVILKAAGLNLQNFFVCCNHVLTPPAMLHILEAREIRGMKPVEIDGFLGPAHVSMVIGSDSYAFFAAEYRKPVVVSGLEPLDILQSVWMLIRMIHRDETSVKNQFTRAVSRKANARAAERIREAFTLRKVFHWRGLGNLPYSAFRIQDAYSRFDIERIVPPETGAGTDHPKCLCPAILRGAARPPDCPLFGKACTPDRPVGACMVSSEGACAAYYTYRREAD